LLPRDLPASPSPILNSQGLTFAPIRLSTAFIGERDAWITGLASYYSDDYCDAGNLSIASWSCWNEPSSGTFQNGGEMNFTILLALIIAGLVVSALARIVVSSLSRKGARAPEITR
jgi:hypothetical protein